MLKSELIEENKNLKKQNGELCYLLEFGKLVCENRGKMLWYKDSNAILLQQENEKLKQENKRLNELPRKVYEELLNREGGESYILDRNGNRVSMDVGYAFEGIEFYLEELERINNEKED